VILFMKARELRRKAALCRRAANIPTSGSGSADRILMVLAEQLERDAVLLERDRGATAQAVAPALDLAG
jgi:hypothetical protein